MSRLALVEIHKDELKFSAGHFMVHSLQQRETMHGHDYCVGVTFYTKITNNGMSFDCRHYKAVCQQLCLELDYHFLLPGQSKFLQIHPTDRHYEVTVAQQTLTFLRDDVIILPVANITLEELSHWFLTRLTSAENQLQEHAIHGIILRVQNGRGDIGASMWGNTSLGVG